MKNLHSKHIFILSISLFSLIIINVQALGQEDENLENPLSSGLKGIKIVNVFVAPTWFVHSIYSKTNIDYKVIRSNVEYELKNNGIIVTHSPKEKDASVMVKIHGTPVNSSGETIAFSYSVSLNLLQDVYLARKKEQFLFGAVTWSKTISSFALKEDFNSSLNNDIDSLLDQLILQYHKSN